MEQCVGWGEAGVSVDANSARKENLERNAGLGTAWLRESRTCSSWIGGYTE